MFEEFELFPTGAHDDIVDAASGAFDKLTESAPLGGSGAPKWIGVSTIRPHLFEKGFESALLSVLLDRCALSNTTIRRGAKIDNLVYIAHGDEIGEQDWSSQ